MALPGLAPLHPLGSAVVADQAEEVRAQLPMVLCSQPPLVHTHSSPAATPQAATAAPEALW